MNVLSSTVKLLHSQRKTVLYNKKHEWFLYSPYCTRGVSGNDSEYLLKHISGNHSAGQQFELQSAKEQLKDIFQNAHTIDIGHRINEVNIQMLSRSLYDQIFGNRKKKEVNNNEKYNNLIAKAQKELKKHGLWTEEVKAIPDVDIELPKLEGEDIEEHFWRIGQEQSEPYKKLMCDFIKNGIPEKPTQWLLQNGWTKYKKGEKPESVPFPDEDAIVFDIEVAVKHGEEPVLAVAVSSDSWYGWVSQILTEKIESIGHSYYVTDMMIPLEDRTKDCDRPRIVVGHNVSYDRARVKEQYSMESSALRFMDTMSLHICVGGASSVQRVSLKGDNSENDTELTKRFCLTSLKDVYAMYCNGQLNKSTRDIFVEGSLEDIRENFQELISYCSDDVKATYEVFQAVFPMYLERFPHPVSLAGMLEMGMAYLTVNNNWVKYIKESQEKFDDLESEMSFLLSKKCDKACGLLHNDEYKKDLWMWNEDWSIQELKLTKKPVKENPIVQQVLEDVEEDEEMKDLMRKFKHLFDLETVLPVVRPLLPGYPAWYRKLCRKPDSPDWVPGPHSMHVTLTIAPKVLNLKYENYPLHYVKELGWGILVPDLNAVGTDTKLPFDELKNVARRNIGVDGDKPESSDTKKRKNEKKEKDVPRYNGTAVFCDHKIDDCCYFLKLPHKDGNNKNVGQPLSKSFAAVLTSHLLTGSDSVSSKGLSVNNMLSYWRNNRDRIMSQMVVWLKPEERGACEGDGAVGVILPKLIVCGTLTRRAVEPTWLTASKAVVERLGSELRSMVQAPPGYHFVGADVDSQELWIASLIGDSHFSKVHGGTPFGWMTISGTKLKGTDLHSITAKAAGISREHAKIINYARIYGAGVKFAEKLLQQFNPSMSSSDVRAKAQKMFTLTKGEQHFRLKEEYKKKLGVKSWQNITFNSVYAAINFAKKYGSTAEIMFEQRKWEGGTESAVFNELEKIANSEAPRTPFLESRLSRALEPRFESDEQFMNTRINWVVQSGAVDFLHLMLVCMRWLTNGQVRYCLSFHDEVRYLVPSQNRYQAALALQITNLLTRSFFAHRVGLYDLPLSVAFFSSVEIDKTMRKEANDDCVTPSNPHGLEKGYDIPKGESLTIYSTLEKSGGHLSCFQNMSQATKRKHVFNEILQEDFIPISDNQQIVKVLESKGNNLHEVESPDSNTFLISMPSKFRKTVWIKKGDYIVVEPIEEGDKVKAEMVKPLSNDYIRYLKSQKQWPFECEEKDEEKKEDDDDDTFVNPNRRVCEDSMSSEESG